MSKNIYHHLGNPLAEMNPEINKFLKQSEALAKPTGLKYDQEKPPMDLIDANFLEGLAKVLGFGASKYAAHNWRGGISVSRLIAASYRHLGAINKGEDIDDESGLPHVYHLACCVMFLSEMLRTRPDLDDRYKPNVPVGSNVPT